MSEAKYKTKHGEGIKILTLKQMLQRLSIALAQAGNNPNIYLIKSGKSYILCIKQRNY